MGAGIQRWWLEPNVGTLLPVDLSQLRGPTIITVMLPDKTKVDYYIVDGEIQHTVVRAPGALSYSDGI